MQCPVDGTQLQMTERQGVEIDYCPKCRGVWLDRGELDKIIDRATPAAAAVESARPDPARPDSARQEPARAAYRDEPRHAAGRNEHYPGHDDRRHGHGQARHRRKGILSELFDFD